MTFTERRAAVEALGFTAHQATFLTTVALHSGYCLRRQYTAFAGLRYGKGTRFLDNLVERGIAGRVVFRAERGVIYHLFSHPVYTAIDHENSRNRRHLSPALLARKLMLLDFVLAHPECDWYVTRADKLDLSVTRLGVSESVRIPTSPFFLHGTSPCVNFVCVVTDPRGSSIESFVRLHASLLRQLNDWTLNALIPECVSTDQACDAIYRRTLAAASMSTMSASLDDRLRVDDFEGSVPQKPFDDLPRWPLRAHGSADIDVRVKNGANHKSTWFCVWVSIEPTASHRLRVPTPAPRSEHWAVVDP